MIQRIQTIFLFIAASAMGAFLFLPLWSKIDPHTFHSYTIYAWKLQELHPIHHITNTWRMPYTLLGSLAVIIGIIDIYALFRFDNRLLQLRLGTINNLLLIILLSILIYLGNKNQAALAPDIVGHYKIGFAMPIIAIVYNLLASYFIRKDEKLIRSTNRIR